MYVMSNVKYKLSNGQVVNTLMEAEASGLKYKKIYEPVNMSYEVPENKAALRRKLE